MFVAHTTRGVEEAAVVYGVGSNRLHLPVPIGVPDGFSLLLKQCFNFTPKHRPQFRQILLHLDILAADPAFIRCGFTCDVSSMGIETL